ncbi:MAG: hypothetical protein AB1941_23875 [Gemmatimonadota bacterium]
MRGFPRRTPTALIAAPVVLLIALGGCAPATPPAATAAPGAAAAVAEGAKVVRVQNNLIPPSSLTVYAVPQTGVRQMLGVLQPSEAKTFTFEPAAIGEYRLVAQATAGSEIVSRDFTFAGTRGVTWDMNSNVISPVAM